MPSFSIVKAANAASKPSYRPVALVLGGTSGIGQAIVETLAKYTDGNVHIIICGRNQASAEAIIAKLYKGPGNSSTYEFLHCDVSLVKNVKKACTELLSRVPKLNYLVLSSGALSLTGRVDSEEGIDNRMALTFYSRFEFVDQLLPLLKNAKAAGEDARVLSILAAGNGGPIDFQDLALKKKYTIPLSMTVPATYNDLMVEEYASRNPDISFIHIYPGLVRTPIYGNTHWVLRFLAPVLLLLFYPFMISAETSSEYMLYTLFDKDLAEGAFNLGQNGDVLPRSKYSTPEAREKVWEHLHEVIDV